jgi:hypothetical protein
MGIIKSFRLFGFKINENVYKPYVTSLENLDAYKKFSEWAEVKLQQSQDGKITKITVYPKGEDEMALKYEIRELTNALASGRKKLSIYQFKDFDWQYVIGYWVSNVSDYENMFSSIEKIALKELYDLDISQKKFLTSPENLEPIEDCGNPNLMASLISRIPEWKVNRYFKENPMSIYMLHECPEIKKKIMDKIGMDSDYSKIGRALKNGII